MTADKGAVARSFSVRPAIPSLIRAALAAAGLAAAQPTLAQALHVTASASAQATYTSNVDFGTTGSARQSDLVGSVTGTVGVTGGSETLQLSGNIAVTGLVDAHGNFTGTIAPVGSIGGTYKAIDNFLYVDASATFSQNYVSPLGAQPRDIVNDTSNRYTSQAYNFAPYIRGVLPGNVSYLVRDQNTWTDSSNIGSTAAKPPVTYANTASANLTSTSGRIGWTVDYNRSYYDSGVLDGTSVTETLRAALPIRITDELVAGPRAGYERDRFLGSSVHSSIYGVQAMWTPTDRTSVNGFWEHRFFGTGYQLSVSHRLPRIALTASFTRDLSNYPQIALTLPASENVSSFVDAALRTRIPDANERAIAVQQFLARSGLPGTLFGPVNFFSTTFLLQTSETLSAAWLGLRNSVTVTLFRVRSSSVTDQDQALLGTFIPEELQFNPNNTQIGMGVSYSRTLTPTTSAGVSASTSRVTSDTGDLTGGVSRATNANLAANLSTQLTPRTTGSVGTGYSWYAPSGGSDVHRSSAWNIFAAISHTFR